jgi:hypothetical protein
MKRIWFLIVLVSLLVLALAPSAARGQRRHGIRVQPSFPQALGSNIGIRAFPSVAAPPSGLHFQFGRQIGTPGFLGHSRHRGFRFQHHPRFRSHPHFHKLHSHPKFRTGGFFFGFQSSV